MSQATQQFGMIPLDCLRESPTNPRTTFDPVKLQELADNIKQIGVGQAILARPMPGNPELVEIVAGARRFRASQMAGVVDIPAVVRDMTDEEVAVFQLVENMKREGVAPLEEAAGLKRLMDEFGKTVESMCEEFGIKRSLVYSRLKLLDLNENVRAMVDSGQLNASIALLIARLPVDAHHEKAAKEIVANSGKGEPMSHRQAKEYLQSRYMLELDTAIFNIQDTKLLKDCGSCTECPKRTGNQPELYADTDHNICTDPDCFSAKKMAHHARLLTLAKKKKLPVYNGIQDFNKNEEDGNHVPAYVRGFSFERMEESSKRYDTIEDLLPADQLPEPKAVIKKDDGSTVAIYERTAIQEALEKAGLALTIEKHSQMMQDKLHSRDGETATEPKIDPRIEIAKQERAYQTALYDKVHGSLNTAQIGDVYRIMLKYFVNIMGTYVDFGLSIDRREKYDCDFDDKESVASFMKTASEIEVLEIYFDIYFNDTKFVDAHDIDDGILVADEDECVTDARVAMLELAVLFNIDVATLRLEFFPPVTVVHEPEPATEAEPTKPKAKGKKAPAAVKTVKNPAASWPFPTAKTGEAT